MASTLRFHYAGVSAYLSGAAVVLSFVTLLLFYAAGEPWGVLYGVALLFQLLFMLPVVFVLRARFGSGSSGLRLLSEWLAIFLIVFVTIAWVLVVFGSFGPRDFVRTVDMSLTISLGIAICLIVLNNWMRDKNLARFSTLALAGYLLTIIVFRYGGREVPLIMLGVLVSAIGFAVWSILLGRILLTDKLSG